VSDTCRSWLCCSVFNVTRLDGVDAIAYDFVDRLMGALSSGGGSEDEHVEVEEEPPEGGGVNSQWRVRMRL
jgi:hypothetical protein